MDFVEYDQAIFILTEVKDGVRQFLEVSSILHDGRYVEDPATPLPDGAVLDVLPPFAGG